MERAALRLLCHPVLNEDVQRMVNLSMPRPQAVVTDTGKCDGPPDQPEHGRQAAAGGTPLQPATNRKTLEGARHPDRDSQFAHINARACTFREAGQPVISVDTKKKELIGPFKNGGSDYRPKGSPEAVNGHDFADKTLGKVAPYGIYDPVDDRGWVSLGIDHDTAEFAVNAIRTWHERIGSVRYRGSIGC